MGNKSTKSLSSNKHNNNNNNIKYHINQPVDILISSNSLQGKRQYNEDRYYVEHPFILNNNNNNQSLTLLCVYDGHGGDKTSEYCAQHMQEHIRNAYNNVKLSSKSHKQHVLNNAYLECDNAILCTQMKTLHDTSGTTAVTVLIDHNEIVVGNVGDTRAILCRDNKPIELSIDHKPVTITERKRIEAASGRVTIPLIPLSFIQENFNSNALKAVQNQASGGYCELNDKGLAVSRALGDFAFKKNPKLKPQQQAVTAEPHVKHIHRDYNNDEFILLCTDGLTNIADNDDCVKFINTRLDKAYTRQAKKQLIKQLKAVNHDTYNNDYSDDDLKSPDITDQDIIDGITSQLSQYALEQDSNDNVTVLLAVFKPYIQRLKHESIQKVMKQAENDQILQSARQSLDERNYQQFVDSMNTLDNNNNNNNKHPQRERMQLTVETIDVQPVNDDVSAIHPSVLGKESVRTASRLQRTIYTRQNTADITHSPLPSDLYTPQHNTSNSNININNDSAHSRQLSTDQLQQLHDPSMPSSTPMKLRSINDDINNADQ